MRQAKVDEARRKRKAGVERDGPSPKKQSDAPGTAPCTPEEEGVQVKAPEEEEEEQLAGQLLADLAVLSENPASMHKYLNKLSTSPAEEAKWAIFSEDLPGVHAGLLAPPREGGNMKYPRDGRTWPTGCSSGGWSRRNRPGGTRRKCCIST